MPNNRIVLLIGSLATIAVLNTKVNQMVTSVATSQLKYTGSVFLTKPIGEMPTGFGAMLKETAPMLAFMFTPKKLWAYIKNASVLKVKPSDKEIYLWNGREFGLVDRPDVSNEHKGTSTRRDKEWSELENPVADTADNTTKDTIAKNRDSEVGNTS
eukprot:COSAG05_NODE_33_length_28089_cov_31.909289_31_plen_156_part_00